MDRRKKAILEPKDAPNVFDIEIIPKKRFLESSFEEIDEDINNFFLSLKSIIFLEILSRYDSPYAKHVAESYANHISEH